MDPITGVLSTKKGVDYETYTIITFDVIATDKGTNPIGPNIGRAPVTITILDVNDKRPVWDCSNRYDPLDEPYEPNPQCFYNMELRDNTLVDYLVLELSAWDVDTVTRKSSCKFVEQ